MQIVPYRPKYAERILNARSVFVPSRHCFDHVTAHIMKDSNGKRLCTYFCQKEWLSHEIPDIEIIQMPKNDVLPLDSEYALDLSIMPNDVQASSIKTVMENGFKKAFFNIPTGIGKTLLSIYLVSMLKVKAWATCYRTIVLDQWMETLATKTDIDISKVAIVHSSKILYKMATGDWDPHKYDIYLSTPMLLTKFAEQYGCDLLNDVMNTCGIGVKFYDEAHKNVGNITKINALTNIDRTYYLSADFGQASPEKQKLYYKMFSSTPIIRPTESQIDAIKYTQGVIIRFDTHPSILEVEGCFTGYGFNGYRFMDYELEKDQFYEAIYRTLHAIHTWDKELGTRYRVLLMCNLINHVDILKARIELMMDEICQFDEEKPHVVRFHSQMPEEEKNDAKLNGDIIVSTHQSMGVGVDLKNIRYVISMCPLNPIEDNQAAGRARALADGRDCYYFMFVDDGFEYAQRQLDERISYLYQQKIKKFSSIKYS